MMSSLLRAASTQPCTILDTRAYIWYIFQTIIRIFRRIYMEKDLTVQ